MTATDMRIRFDGIGHALSDNRLAVPIYQRSYAWEERHITDLYADLANAIARKEPEYFLGSIVVVKLEDHSLELVDGQQRLATITILLAAIRDYFYTHNERKRSNFIDNTYLLKIDGRTLETLPQLRLNALDRDYFEHRILSNPDDPARNDDATRESYRRINQAANIAHTRVEQIVAGSSDPTDRLLDWVYYIHDSAKIILFTAHNYSDAFVIFETLNDRGLDLAIADLLKNAIFSKSGQDRLDTVQQRWAAMTSTLEATGGDDQLLLSYIRHYYLSKYGVARERELYDKIRQRITSRQAALAWSEGLAREAQHYAAIISGAHEIWSNYGVDVADNINIINLLGMVQIRPLLLAILDVFDVDDVRKALRSMVSWGVRFLIVGGLGGGVLEGQYARRAQEVRDHTIKSAGRLARSMQIVVPNDVQFKNAFMTATVPKANHARYYLRALEGCVVSGGGQLMEPSRNVDLVNLEHVLPANPSAAWAGMDSEVARTYYNRLGNLALMEKQANRELGSKGFDDKKVIYAVAPFELTREIAAFDRWGPEEIQARQSQLAALAVTAWPV